MTTTQLRAELFREMNPLLDSEVAMTKMLAFVKSLITVSVTSGQSDSVHVSRSGWAVAARQAHEDGQDKLLMDDVFADESMEDWKW